MRILKVKDIHTQKEISEKITSVKGYHDVLDWKIIQCVKQNPDILASQIAKVFCISIQKVYKVVQDYNRQESSFKLETQWGGRRKETSYLSLNDENAFFEEISGKALKGEIITAKDVKAALETKIGRTISFDYIWKLFKRHKWTKKSVRPQHPKTQFDKQEEFKKNYKIIWLPPE